MILRTEIAAGGSGGSAQARTPGRPPTLGSVQHEAYCQLAYQLFFNSPSLSSPALVHNVPAQPGSAQAHGTVGSQSSVQKSTGMALGRIWWAFPQVLMAWQCGVDCPFLAG